MKQYTEEELTKIFRKYDAPFDAVRQSFDNEKVQKYANYLISFYESEV